MSVFDAQVRRRGAGDGTDAPVAVIELRGQLDGAAAGVLEQASVEATMTGLAAVVLDFGAVTYINSTGIALVVGLLARARAAEIEVRVCGLTEHYRHIFDITRLADFMTVFPDEQAAVAGSQRPAVGGSR